MSEAPTQIRPGSGVVESPETTMSAFHSNFVQRALALAFAASAAFAPARVSAQTPMLSAATPVAPLAARAAVPYSVGEALTYRATFGGSRAGTAR